MLLLLDGPDDGDSYLYRLADNQSSGCDVYTDHTCGGHYIEGTNLWTWGENIGSPYSLAEFLKGALRAYPQANQVLLSLVGHGGGWSPELLDVKPAGDLGGLLWDDHPGDSLSTPDLGKALRWAQAATGKGIDLLYLDACLMAMWEVAYEVHDSVDFLLASEAWSWTSFSHDAHLEDIDGKSSEEIGVEWLNNEAEVLRADDYPFTYSLLDLGEMPALRQEIDDLSTALQDVLPADRDKLEDVFEETECFDSNQNGPINSQDSYCDLDSFAIELELEFVGNVTVTNAALGVQNMINTAVVTEDHNSGIPWFFPYDEWVWDHLGGLSIYLPLGQDEWKRRYYTANHLRSAQDGTWDEFIAAYWSGIDPPPDPICTAGCDLPPGPGDTSPENDDLFGRSAGLWTEPQTPSAGSPTQLGLVVQRQGGKETISGVPVKFYIGPPEAPGSIIVGDSTVPFLSPRSEASTIPIIWTFGTAGTFTLYAVIDYTDIFSETDETNNVVSRTVTVQTPPVDRVPPRIESFSINHGAISTTVQTVTLNTVASDPDPSSGLGWLYFVEYRFWPALGIWAPCQFSGWQRYEDAYSDYEWVLCPLGHPTAGPHIIKVWAADRARNISSHPGSAMINYVPPIDHVGWRQSRFYRYPIETGQQVTVRIEPFSGDPDLYVWPPDYDTRPPWVSTLSDMAIDEVSFTAPISEVYQVEVYGFETSSYHLTVDITSVPKAIQVSGGIVQSKEPLTRPFVPLNSVQVTAIRFRRRLVLPFTYLLSCVKLQGLVSSL